MDRTVLVAGIIDRTGYSRRELRTSEAMQTCVMDSIGKTR
jgi:hypothetical protein